MGSLGPHLEKNIKMITYDDQTSQGVSTTPELRVCTCDVIKKIIINVLNRSRCVCKYDLTPRFNGSKMVAPPDGVHCCSSDSARRYLLTHFDRFQA